MPEGTEKLASNYIRYAGYVIYVRVTQRPGEDRLRASVLVKDPDAPGFGGETEWDCEEPTTHDELRETTRVLLHEAKAYVDGNDTPDRTIAESLSEVFGE